MTSKTKTQQILQNLLYYNIFTIFIIQTIEIFRSSQSIKKKEKTLINLCNILKKIRSIVIIGIKVGTR